MAASQGRDAIGPARPLTICSLTGSRRSTCQPNTLSWTPRRGPELMAGHQGGAHPDPFEPRKAGHQRASMGLSEAAGYC